MTMLSVPRPATSASQAQAEAHRTQRLVSLDALRGFDMFWIIGGEVIFHEWAKWKNWSILQHISNQLEHTDWAGLTAYDLIFPTFVFVVGAALVFSLSKQIALGGRAAAMRRLLVRGVVLYLIGIAYYGIITKNGHPQLRLMGVLQRIAIAYTFAGLLFCYLKPRNLAIVAAAILIGYWALLSFVPVRGVGHASFEEGQNWTNWIDANYLTGYKWDGNHDPEGLLSNLPAIVTCILGIFAGIILRDARVSAVKKVGYLIVGGAACLAVGYLWGLQFPIIKKLWTSTFVLVAAGYASILLGLFYLIIDVWKIQFWARPFVWIGGNAITLYLLWRFFEFNRAASRLVGSGFQDSHSYGKFVIALIAAGTIILLARFLYKRQIFLRI
jgi:predicted acyltransferase